MKRTTEHQYVQKIKKYYRWRKLIGAIGLVICLLGAIGVYVGFTDMTERTGELVRADILLSEGQIVHPDEIEKVDSFIGISQSLGIKAGIFVGQYMTLFGVIGIACIATFFGGRKDYLLIKYYEKSQLNGSVV